MSMILRSKWLIVAICLVFACTKSHKNQESETSDQMRLLYPEKPRSGAIYLDTSKQTEERISDLISKMTLQQKAAQMSQGEIPYVSPKDIATYGLGSVLNGGNTNPGNNTIRDWQQIITDYQEAAFSRDLKIPIIYGTDAVHGHSNLKGATIFPHNIGLGAANNDSLMFLMGKITGAECLLTNVNWTFAPCLALAMDPRWGRTYESFSTNEEIVTRLGKAFTNGLLSANVVGSAKHYLGDGGTTMGSGLDGKLDRGNTVIAIEDLRKTLLPPYQAQINAGMQTIMPSYSSINGIKMHERADLINDLLKEELGFTGFTISDWQAIEEISATSFERQVWTAVNSGIDMIMQPEKWKMTIDAIVAGVEKGTITTERIDDAVSRILKVKFESGLFEDPLVIKNPARANELRSPDAVAIATRLAEESLVLLKNNNELLPLKENAKVFITGKGSDDMGLQCGGWTIGWQGTADNGQKVTEGSTILEGLKNLAPEMNLEIITEPSRATEADVVVAVIAEEPYAEMHGDTKDLSITGSHAHEENQKTIDLIASLNKPTVVVILAGRQQVDLGNFLDDWDAVVMAYWPGSEGGQALANVIAGKRDFSGKLPMPWYRSVNDIGKRNTSLLFDLGYGLSY
jgi:beta-glucosidase